MFGGSIRGSRFNKFKYVKNGCGKGTDKEVKEREVPLRYDASLG